LGIVFGLGVFVTDAQVQREVLSNLPIVLKITGVLMSANVVQRLSGLEVVIGQTKEEVGEIGARADGG